MVCGIDTNLSPCCFSKVMNSHSLRGGQLGDYCDGELFLQHPIFTQDPCALQIQLYYDELELFNPLGSKKLKLGRSYIPFSQQKFLSIRIALANLNIHQCEL